MKPFQIHCTTCNARLTVRNEDAIGQILSCPKCQSMVLVETPADYVEQEGQAGSPPEVEPEVGVAPSPQAPPSASYPAASRPASFSAADTVAGDYDSPEQLVGDLGHSQVASEPKLDGAVATPEGELPGGSQDDGVGSESSATQAGSTEPADATASTIPPSSDWTTRKARQMRQWLLTGAAAVGGVVLAISFFGFLIAQRRGQNQLAQANPTSLDAQSDPEADSQTGQPLDEPDGAADEPRENGQADDETMSNDPMGRGEPVDGDPPASSATGSDAASVAQPEPASDTEGPEVKPEDVPPSVGPEAGDPPQDTVPNPDLDPDLNPNLEPGAQELPFDLTPGSQTTADPLGLESAMPTAESLRAFEDLISGSAPVVPLAAPTDPTAVVEVPVTDSNVLQELPRPKPRVISVERQLALPLVGIQFQNTPLRDFVNFVSDFSLLAITLDGDAMSAAQLTLETPITVKLIDTSVQDLLESVFTPHKLAVVPTEAGVRVTFPLEITPQAYDVADLTGGSQQQLETLIQHLNELIEPTQWKRLGGPWEISTAGQQIVVSAPAEQQFRALQIFERLRAARGLPLQSSLPAERFEPGTRFTKTAEALSRKLTLNFVRERPLVEVLGQIGDQSAMQITVDWDAATAIGWNPDTEVQVVTDGKPLSMVLNRLLHPMQMSYRVVNSSLLQITTPQALRTTTELESYRIPRQVTGDTAVEAVYGLFGKEWFREGGGIGTIRYDATADILLVCLPQPQQIALERLLRQWE